MADYDMGTMAIEDLLTDAGLSWPDDISADATELDCLGSASGSGGSGGGSGSLLRTVPRLRRIKP